MSLMTKKLIGIVILVLLPLSLALGQQIIEEDTKPEEITSGYEFTEGPLWHNSGYLLFSDIPANIVYQWMPGEGAVEYLNPSGHSNGLTFDQNGRLLLAQHDGAISRLTEGDELETVVDNYEGKRLNSPNDLVVKSDGSIYFTDPPYGVSDAEQELDVNGVYRYSENGGLQLLVEDFNRPNGIVFSPDEDKLYVNDTSNNQIRVYRVNNDGTLSDEEIFATMEGDEAGAADGMKVDVEGNLYTTGPGGVWIFSPEGELIQQVKMPVRITNLAWGGSGDSTLFMTSPDAVYKIETTQTGER